MKLTKEIRKKIIELAPTTRHSDIGKLLGLSGDCVSKFLKKEKIILPKSRVNMSKLTININYFKKINSHKKAYWLGYLCADGCMKNKKCSLVSKDKEIIEKFKKDIKSEHKISYNKILDKRTNKINENYSIQITNEIFVNHLINLGIGPNKSLVCNFPKISEKFYCSFIAGLFDGDGSVCNNTNKKTIRVNLISTKEILEFILSFLNSKLNIKRLPLIHIKENTYKMYFYKDVIKFLSFIYSKNNKMYLQRKYKKYNEQKNSIL